MIETGRKKILELLLEDYPELADRETYASLWALINRHLQNQSLSYTKLLTRVRLGFWTVPFANELAEIELKHLDTLDRLYEDYQRRMADFMEHYQKVIDEANEQYEAELRRKKHDSTL